MGTPEIEWEPKISVVALIINSIEPNMEQSNNNKNKGIYKYTENKDSRAVYNTEKENKINTYGRNTYISKLINLFKNSKSHNSDYWIEVGK